MPDPQRPGSLLSITDGNGQTAFLVVDRRGAAVLAGFSQVGFAAWRSQGREPAAEAVSTVRTVADFAKTCADQSPLSGAIFADTSLSDTTDRSQPLFTADITDVKGAAALLHLSDERVRQLVRSGQIGRVRVGEQTDLIDRRDVVRLAADRSAKR